MESSRKHRGFIKSKLTPFYRSAKPSTTTSVQYSSKAKSSASQSSPSTASVGFIFQNHHHQHLHQQQQQQGYMAAPPKPKVSFVVPDSSTVGQDKLGLSKLDKLCGVAADESVDIKAESYISSVRERFKLERAHPERIMQREDMQQT